MAGTFSRSIPTIDLRPTGPSREQTKFAIENVRPGHFRYTIFWVPDPPPPTTTTPPSHSGRGDATGALSGLGIVSGTEWFGMGPAQGAVNADGPWVFWHPRATGALCTASSSLREPPAPPHLWGRGPWGARIVWGGARSTPQTPGACRGAHMYPPPPQGLALIFIPTGGGDPSPLDPLPPCPLSSSAPENLGFGNFFW